MPDGVGEGQTWKSLLFAHWPVAPESLSAVMPPQPQPDPFDGRAWIAVTSFPRAQPAPAAHLPAARSSRHFPRSNVRTYVTQRQTRDLLLQPGRRQPPRSRGRAPPHRLPFFRARMSMRAQSRDACFDTERTGPQPDAPPARFQADYRPRKLFQASPGTLEHWLTKRHCP